MKMKKFSGICILFIVLLSLNVFAIFDFNTTSTDMTDYYTKAQTDNIFTSYYNKSETDNLINNIDTGINISCSDNQILLYSVDEWICSNNVEDTNTQLSESQVDNYVSNNGYLTD